MVSLQEEDGGQVGLWGVERIMIVVGEWWCEGVVAEGVVV